jgi:hypothetical protein
LNRYARLYAGHNALKRFIVNSSRSNEAHRNTGSSAFADDDAALLGECSEKASGQEGRYQPFPAI